MSSIELDKVIQGLKETILEKNGEIKFLKEEHECNLLIQQAQRNEIEHLKEQLKK